MIGVGGALVLVLIGALVRVYFWKPEPPVDAGDDDFALEDDEVPDNITTLPGRYNSSFRASRDSFDT